MKKSGPKLSIIIPAYNEEKNIYKTVDEIVNSHDALPYGYEVIVVVDGSPDNTAIEAKRHKSKNVKVHEYFPNQGKGYALKFGTMKAKGDIITFTDAGGDFSPMQFDNCVKLMEIFDADFVIGSKRHPASKVNYPLKRKAYSYIYHKFTRWFLGVKVSDTQAGLKFLKKDVAKDIMPRVLVKQYAFDLEMLTIANQLGYHRVFEAPIEMDFNGISSGINFRTIKRMVIDTLAIFYRARILDYYRKHGDKKRKSRNQRQNGSKKRARKIAK
jgi:dolichol-phosphate mannosyltransferase